MNFKLIFLVLIIKIINVEKNLFVNGVYRGDNRVGTDFKYHVQIIYRNGENIRNYCGGTVIDDCHIVTAAHCIYNAIETNISVFAGSTNLKVGGNTYRVKKIHIHENFKHEFRKTQIQRLLGIASHDENDIAVLTLADVLPIGENIEKVELPNQDISPCSETAICKFAGWSDFISTQIIISDKLLWTLIEIQTPLYCLIRSMSPRNNEFCAQDPLKVAKPIQGESGGGLVCDGILVGILSAGKDPVFFPDLYVNIYDFRPFIDKILEIDQKDCQSNKENEEPNLKKPRIQ